MIKVNEAKPSKPTAEDRKDSSLNIHPWHSSIMASERAAIRIWELIRDKGQDALSHTDYQEIISEEIQSVG